MQEKIHAIFYLRNGESPLLKIDTADLDYQPLKGNYYKCKGHQPYIITEVIQSDITTFVILQNNGKFNDFQA